MLCLYMHTLVQFMYVHAWNTKACFLYYIQRLGRTCFIYHTTIKMFHASWKNCVWIKVYFWPILYQNRLLTIIISKFYNMMWTDWITQNTEPYQKALPTRNILKCVHIFDIVQRDCKYVAALVAKKYDIEFLCMYMWVIHIDFCRRFYSCIYTLHV